MQGNYVVDADVVEPDQYVQNLNADLVLYGESMANSLPVDEYRYPEQWIASPPIRLD